MLRAVSKPADAVYVLASSNTAVSVTGTTTKTALATVSIPAGRFVSGSLRIRAIFSLTSSANNKTLSFEYAGNNIVSTVLTNSSTIDLSKAIYARSASSQFVQPSTTLNGGSGVAISTYAVDATAAQNITINGTLADSGETITLESYSIEYLP